jgi:hypothetical protein
MEIARRWLGWAYFVRPARRLAYKRGNEHWHTRGSMIEGRDKRNLVRNEQKFLREKAAIARGRLHQKKPRPGAFMLLLWRMS